MHHARLLRSSVAFVALASWIVVASGCPGTLTEEEKKMFQGGGSCPDIPSLLTAKCGLSGCHAQGSTPDLGSAGVEARIVGKTSSPTCGGAVLANPAAPEESLLYKKLLDSPSCGSKMPIGATLSPLEIDCIKDWIGTLDPNAGTGGSGGGSGGGGGAGGTGGTGGTGG
jgi:hypothetical protein